MASKRLAELLRDRGTDLAELAKTIGTTRCKLEEMLEGRRRFPADLFITICLNQSIRLQEVMDHESL